MDSTTLLALVTLVLLMLIVGELVPGPHPVKMRWVWITAFIGPLVIPVLALVAATSALRKLIKARNVRPT